MNSSTGHRNINKNGSGTGDDIYKSKCKKCGAIRIDQQIGLEYTPEEYIDVMVQIFREVKRVLKPTGTFWLNIGDTYWGGKGQSGQA